MSSHGIMLNSVANGTIAGLGTKIMQALSRLSLCKHSVGTAHSWLSQPPVLCTCLMQSICILNQ